MNCRLRGVECGGYAITLTDFTAQSGQKGQMVSKMRRGGPEVVNGQHIPVENLSDMPSETGLRDLASPLGLTDELEPEPEPEPDMSFLEALTAESLGPNPIEDYDISISSTDLDMIQDWSADTWSAGNQLIEDNADILDSSLLGSFCDPILYQTPQDPFDQYLFSHCECLDLS